MWLKYSDAPILAGEQYDVPQSHELGKYNKPLGFWITDDSKDCWRSWCIGEQFGLERLTHKHEIVLDESGILFLRTPCEILDFHDGYGVEKWWGPDGQPRKYRDWCIDWRRVAEQYAGIIITPYQWTLRLNAGTDWYYGWDCASGCIWKASAIREIRLIEIDRAVVTARPRYADDADEAA